MTCNLEKLSFVSNQKDSGAMYGSIREYICTTLEHVTYSLLGNVTAIFEANTFKPGSTFLTIPGHLIDAQNRIIDVDQADSSEIKIYSIEAAVQEATGINARTGTHTILVLRDSDTRGATPQRSAATISSDLFSDPLNLVRKWKVRRFVLI